MLQRGSENVFRKTVVFKRLDLNFKLKDLKTSEKHFERLELGGRSFERIERPPIAHVKILNTSWKRFKIEKLPFLERLHLDFKLWYLKTSTRCI